MFSARHLICTFLLLPTLAFAGEGSADDPASSFQRDILPILGQRCGKCHAREVRKGGLDLSSLEGIRQGGESGAELLGESIEESHLWEVIDAGEMPPSGHEPLTQSQRDKLHHWIASRPNETWSARPITQHDVLPIVLLRCTCCHGTRLRRAELDLRTPAAMLIGGQSGPAIVPGAPDDSLMIQRIESEACPPRGSLLKFFVKRPPKSEVQTLRAWIAAGAPVSDVAPDVATSQPDPMVTDQDRAHWSFQPPRKSTTANTIDEFIIKRLRKAGLDLADEADRDTLIRRAHFDLIGMPPEVSQWRRWRESKDPNWYREMVEQLLRSPRYGERWGRYWLDVAGYADSEGGVSADPVRPVAWKYRDYVIDAFNNDLPYDQFLTQQIAGDELIDYEQAPEVTQEMVKHLVATGFLRMGIDQTGSRTMNFVPERLGVIADAITVLGSGVMGLTMECARCHSHKYDPIPHRDYYRFKAIFQGAYDEHDWLSFKTRTIELGTAKQLERIATVNPPLQAELKSLQAKLKQSVSRFRTELLREQYPDQTDADRTATLIALKKADNNRTLPERELVEKLQQAELVPESEQGDLVRAASDEMRRLELAIAERRQRMEPPAAIRALWDRGEPSPTYILLGGEAHRPGRLVGPGVPSVLTDGRTPLEVNPPFPDGTPKTGRRLALARWLTQPDHPLTARVMVNRVWYHHFGSGLVETLENFGVQGSRPTHPELLDWLAIEFVRRGWSVKELHRMIMNSRTYRQSSRVGDRQAELDPQNRMLSRMPLRRMDAEALRDTLLMVAGRLNLHAGGPPDAVRVARDGMVSAVSTEGMWRRSVYLQYRRTEIPTMMDTFDYPEMGPNCVARNESNVAPQSLMLMNNHHVRELARSMATRIEQTIAQRAGMPRTGTEVNSADAERLALRVDAVYQSLLTRSPTPTERRLGVKSMRELQSHWQGDSHAALETYCHTLLNSAAFLYID